MGNYSNLPALPTLTSMLPVNIQLQYKMPFAKLLISTLL